MELDGGAIDAQLRVDVVKFCPYFRSLKVEFIVYFLINNLSTVEPIERRNS